MPTGVITPALGSAGALTGTFYYNVTYVTALGETAPGSAVPFSISPSSQRVNLTTIPVSPSPLVIARKIYRSSSAEPRLMEYLATINDNTTTTYTDNDPASSGIFASWSATNRGVIKVGDVAVARFSDLTTSLGYDAFGDNNPGYASTAIGYFALHDNTSGRRNTAVGVFSLESTTTGFENTAVGVHSAGALTTASANTMVGYAAGSVSNSMGNQNTALGAYAFSAAATKGVNNVAVGANTFASAVGTLNSCIALGWSAGKYATTSDTVFIDTRDRTNIAGAQDQGLIYGIASGAPSANQRLHLNAATRIGCPAAAGSASKTVAQLQTASSALIGFRDYVTDANATTFASIVAGGGSTVVPVYCDGVNWRIG